MSEPIDFDCPTCHAKAGRPCNPVWDHDKRIDLAGGGEHWTRKLVLGATDVDPRLQGKLDETVSLMKTEKRARGSKKKATK